MQGTCQLVCWDQGYADPRVRAEIADRLAPDVELTAHAPTDNFSLVLMMDVLEHVADDRAFLNTIVRSHLMDDGRLLISVPAWPQLFSSHDRALSHYRRYRPSEMRRLLRENGLTLDACGGLFGSLAMVRVAQVIRDKFFSSSMSQLQDWRMGKAVTRLVTIALDLDGEFGYLVARAGVDLPGLSWWALCRKTPV
jgi:hypothetical protein